MARSVFYFMWGLGLALIFCAVVWSLISMEKAEAAESGQSPAVEQHQAQHDFWINNGNYKSPTDGSHCCGDNDCKVIFADDVKITPRGYVLSNGEIIPYSEAQQSEDGEFWHCKRHDGSRRCFFAPMQAY